MILLKQKGGLKVSKIFFTYFWVFVYNSSQVRALSLLYFLFESSKYFLFVAFFSPSTCPPAPQPAIAWWACPLDPPSPPPAAAAPSCCSWACWRSSYAHSAIWRIPAAGPALGWVSIAYFQLCSFRAYIISILYIAVSIGAGLRVRFHCHWRWVGGVCGRLATLRGAPVEGVADRSG